MAQITVILSIKQKHKKCSTLYKHRILLNKLQENDHKTIPQEDREATFLWEDGKSQVPEVSLRYNALTHHVSTVVLHSYYAGEQTLGLLYPLHVSKIAKEY